jgi:hypothetical protein
MSSPEEVDARALFERAFEGVDAGAIDRRFDKRIVFDNFGTLINLVDVAQMDEGINYRSGHMYVNPLGKILAAGAYHMIDPEVIYAEGVQELDLYVYFVGDQQQFEYDVPPEGELPDRARANLAATLERCNSFDQTI